MGMFSTASRAMWGAYRVRPSKDNAVVPLTRKHSGTVSGHANREDRQLVSIDVTCVGISKISD